MASILCSFSILRGNHLEQNSSPSLFFSPKAYGGPEMSSSSNQARTICHFVAAIVLWICCANERVWCTLWVVKNAQASIDPAALSCAGSWEAASPKTKRAIHEVVRADVKWSQCCFSWSRWSRRVCRDWSGNRARLCPQILFYVLAVYCTLTRSLSLVRSRSAESSRCLTSQILTSMCFMCWTEWARPGFFAVPADLFVAIDSLWFWFLWSPRTSQRRHRKGTACGALISASFLRLWWHVKQRRGNVHSGLALECHVSGCSPFLSSWAFNSQPTLCSGKLSWAREDHISTISGKNLLFWVEFYDCWYAHRKMP